MANFIIFNSSSAPVRNLAFRYLRSQNSTLFKGREDAIRNPEIPDGIIIPPGNDVPIGHLSLKVENKLLVKLSQPELDAVAQAQTTAADVAEAQRIADAKEYARGVLDGDEGEQVFSKAQLTWLIKQINPLNVKAGFPTITAQSAKQGINDEIT